MERTDFEQWKGKEVARLLALVETERRYYQEMVAILPVGIAILTGDRSIVLANRAFRQTFGVRGDEIRRKTIEQILPSDQLVEKIRAVHLETGAEAASHGGLTLEFAGKLLRIDVRPIRSWDEEMELETLLAIQDLSAAGAKRADTIAAPAPNATAATSVAPTLAFPVGFPVEDLPAIVWQADAGTLNFSTIDGSGLSVLGLAPLHWLGTDGFFEQRIHAEDRDATMALYRSIVEHGGEASAEFRMAASSGELKWCRETVVTGPPGEGPRKIYGVLTFIGERTRMQRQMEVAARHDALTAVSARLAHDLNNPLMLITGYAEEMSNAFPEGDARRDDVEQIVKATERITEITSHLTRFARRGTTQPESVNLAASVARLESRFARMAGEGVALVIETSEETGKETAKQVWALAKVRPLEELLITLADVAGDCPGCTELRIACDWTAVTERIPEATLAPGLYACITVQANGTGIDAMKSASLFESILNKSADSTRGEALAQAYALVREWGGDLAYSGEAAHSKFVLYLRPSDAVAAAAPPEIPAPEPAPPQPLILVVDDEPGIRALVAKILRREGYEVLESGAAADAGLLAGAQTRPVELLVTDIMLPDHPGTELAQQLREQLPAIKVLYMSGYTEDERARTGDFPPGAKFLQKPFTLGALVARVRESLEEA